MTTFDYILLAVALVVLAQQITLLIRARREIVIHGTPPNRKTVMVLLAAVLVIAVFRTDNLTHTWPVFVIIAIACLMIFSGGCGLSADGMFSGGRYIPFAQAAYYEMDERGGRRVLRLSRLSRETHMIVTDEQLSAVMEILENNSIPRYEDYNHKVAKRVSTRMEAQQRKKKKKK